jgi:hypothetical protein
VLICIVLVDARDALQQTVLLLVFIKYDWFDCDIPAHNFEATFVGNPVAVPAGRQRRLRAAHSIEDERRERN